MVPEKYSGDIRAIDRGTSAQRARRRVSRWPRCLRRRCATSHAPDRDVICRVLHLLLMLDARFATLPVSCAILPVLPGAHSVVNGPRLADWLLDAVRGARAAPRGPAAAAATRRRRS